MRPMALCLLMAALLILIAGSRARSETVVYSKTTTSNVIPLSDS